MGPAQELLSSWAARRASCLVRRSLSWQNHPLPTQHISSAEDFTTHQLVHDTIVRWLRDEASLHVDQIDYDAPLFDLGIDSLGAANIGCQLEEHTGKTLHPEVLYELETINELAEHLDSLSVSKRHESEISLPATVGRGRERLQRVAFAVGQRGTSASLRTTQSPSETTETGRSVLLRTRDLRA